MLNNYHFHLSHLSHNHRLSDHAQHYVYVRSVMEQNVTTEQ